jgi:hypothetical protein
MTTSKHAGERAAAGLKATEYPRELELGWEEVLFEDRSAAGTAQSRTTWRTWHMVCDETLTGPHKALLNAPREVDFLTSLMGRRRPLTPKQATWLADITWRCEVRPWDGAP